LIESSSFRGDDDRENAESLRAFYSTHHEAQFELIKKRKSILERRVELQQMSLVLSHIGLR